jgi:radial spoke head protein 3
LNLSWHRGPEHYDQKVGPILQVLEEEELAAMRAHQEHFEQVRNAELVATQKMEQAECRKVEEKERRLQQERERLQREKVVREKVAAATFARSFLTGMVDTVISSLWTQGYFYDAVERSVKESFMPWLRVAVDAELSQRQTAREALAKLVASVVGMAEETRKQRRAEHQAQCERLKNVHVRCLATSINM